MNNNELKQNLIDYLRDNPKTFNAQTLAKLFAVRSSDIRRELEGEPFILASTFSSHVVYSYAREKQAVVMKNRLKGEWKPDTAMKIAMDRCRESRGDELHTLAMTGGEKMFNSISGA